MLGVNINMQSVETLRPVVTYQLEKVISERAQDLCSLENGEVLRVAVPHKDDRFHLYYDFSIYFQGYLFNKVHFKVFDGMKLIATGFYRF